jgi:septum formation protein
MALILASQSPRRREILARAGLEFQVAAAGVDESVAVGETPGQHVRRLARAKAEAVPLPAAAVVLAADTVVVVDGEILGKPADAGEAARMLRRLAGRWHEVVTGICLRTATQTWVGAETTRVRFRPLSEDEIRLYAASGEPLDKAGGYAIQGLASKFIDRIEGCYFNVMGLPVALVYRQLCALTGRLWPAGAPGRPAPGEQKQHRSL